MTLSNFIWNRLEDSHQNVNFRHQSFKEQTVHIWETGVKHFPWGMRDKLINWLVSWSETHASYTVHV